MRKLAALICFTFALSPLAMAQDKGKADEKKAPPAAAKAKKEPSAKQKAQQDKMKNCTAQANEKKMKNPERSGFMKDCMKKG